MWWRRSQTAEWRRSEIRRRFLVGNWCGQFRTITRLCIHINTKLCFSLLLPQLYFRKEYFFFSCFEKRLVGMFRLKQIGLLVLPRRREFIHEEREWKGWLPSRAVNSSDWQSKDLAAHGLCTGLSFCLSQEKIYSVAHYRATHNVVNVLRWIKWSCPFLPGCGNWSQLWWYPHETDLQDCLLLFFFLGEKRPLCFTESLFM